MIKFLADVLAYANLAQYDFLTNLLDAGKRSEFIAAALMVADRQAQKNNRPMQIALERLHNCSPAFIADVLNETDVSHVEFVTAIAGLKRKKAKTAKPNATGVFESSRAKDCEP